MQIILEKYTIQKTFSAFHFNLYLSGFIHFAGSQLDVLIYNFENIKELVKATMVEKRCDENEGFKIVFKECVLHHSSFIR